MANNSEINRKLSAAQHSNAGQFVAFGDSIYVPDTHIRRIMLSSYALVFYQFD